MYASKIDLHSLVGLIYPATEAIWAPGTRLYRLRLGDPQGGARVILCITWLESKTEVGFYTLCPS
jgi:hypothetical protein